jgi:hypothetical protein
MVLSLEQIFESININYKRIRVIVNTIPKTGTHTLLESISLPPSEHVIAFHSIIELGYLHKDFLFYREKRIIEFILESTELDKVYILSSYREPISRTISHYHHNQKLGLSSKELSLSTVSFDFLFHKVGCHDVVFAVKYLRNIWENEFGIDFSSNNLYCKRKGYIIMEPNALPDALKKKCVWLFTCLDDFNVFFQNQENPVGPFLKKQIEKQNVNHDDTYLKSKNKIKWDEICLYTFLKEEERMIRFFNIQYERVFKFHGIIKTASENLMRDVLSRKYEKFVSTLRNKYKEDEC